MNSLPSGFISHLTAGRSQIGTSLSFHLFFAVLGVGLPLMMLVAEGMHLRTGDPGWRALARCWSRVFGVLFAVGAASGTIISFELGLLFPRFMAYAGGIIGLPFSLEGAAFFLEAIFLGIYLYGWTRLSRYVHWLSGIPIAISAVASAFFIVTANAWMNVPSGFQIVHGRVAHVDPVAAMFNPAWATETSHMVLGAYLATAFGIASVYAIGMLRGRRDAYHRKAITLALRIVEFGDLQCPYCDDFATRALPSLVTHYVRPGKVSIEFRNLSFIGPGSVRAGLAAAGAEQQNMLWNFVDLMYLNQGQENSGYVTNAYLHRLLSAIPGLDVARAERATQTPQATAALAAANAAAVANEINSTPSFLVGRVGSALRVFEPNSLTAGPFAREFDSMLAGR